MVLFSGDDMKVALQFGRWNEGQHLGLLMTKLLRSLYKCRHAGCNSLDALTLSHPQRLPIPETHRLRCPSIWSPQAVFGLQ
ncbi:hypothetical protein PENSPDRAFT_656021 [Peniophora sp. CONT]|nr:hypothetical protein PENSPDRAFT_656021 [Peniophora sp. CONT]